MSLKATTIPACYSATLYAQTYGTFQKLQKNVIWNMRTSLNMLNCHIHRFDSLGHIYRFYNRILFSEFCLICIRCMWFHFRISQNGMGKMHSSCLGAIITRSKLQWDVKWSSERRSYTLLLNIFNLNKVSLKF